MGRNVFHVGGLGIHARAHLSGARVIEMTVAHKHVFDVGGI